MKSILGMVAAGVVAVAVLVGFGTGIVATAGGQREPPVEKAAAEPISAPSAQSLSLQYVPADAAIFIHLDAQRFWAGPIGTGARQAQPKLLAEFAGKIKAYTGAAPEGIESVTVFIPSLQKPQTEQTGLVFAFRAPVDRAQVLATVETHFPKELKPSVHIVSDRVVVLLLDLDAKYAKPRAADARGPLSAALQEAATGRYMLVVGATGANLPDEIRGDNLPPPIRVFRPLLEAETAALYVTQGKELAVEVKVKANTPAKAGEAEKALGLLVTILRESLEGLASAPVTGNDQATKDLDKLIKGAIPGVKAATYSTEGTETRAKLAIPTDLPLGAVVIPQLLRIREAAARTQSANNLKQIGLAMHVYHDAHNSFPPAAVVDKAGKPMLSWRVLILPYIEQEALYKEFHLDEPWDSDHNKKLIPKMPKTYALPDATDAKPGETHYRVFVGNGAAFDPVRGVKLTEFTDGTSETILAVTAAESVPWTKPDELTYDPAKDPRKLLWVGSSNGTNILFGDGSVRFLSNQISAKLLHRLITRAEGVPAKDD